MEVNSTNKLREVENLYIFTEILYIFNQIWFIFFSNVENEEIFGNFSLKLEARLTFL